MRLKGNGESMKLFDGEYGPVCTNCGKRLSEHEALPQSDERILSLADAAFLEFECMGLYCPETVSA